MMRQELSADEKEKLGKHAGELARVIRLKVEARAAAAKAAKEEIDDLQETLAGVHEELRTGFREVGNQQDMFAGGESRVDHLRDVVKQARERLQNIGVESVE